MPDVYFVTFDHVEELQIDQGYATLEPLGAFHYMLSKISCMNFQLIHLINKQGIRPVKNKKKVIFFKEVLLYMTSFIKYKQGIPCILMG